MAGSEKKKNNKGAKRRRDNVKKQRAAIWYIAARHNNRRAAYRTARLSPRPRLYRSFISRAAPTLSRLARAPHHHDLFCLARKRAWLLLLA